MDVSFSTLSHPLTLYLPSLAVAHPPLFLHSPLILSLPCTYMYLLSLSLSSLSSLILSLPYTSFFSPLIFSLSYTCTSFLSLPPHSPLLSLLASLSHSPIPPLSLPSFSHFPIPPLSLSRHVLISAYFLSLFPRPLSLLHLLSLSPQHESIVTEIEEVLRKEIIAASTLPERPRLVTSCSGKLPTIVVQHWILLEMLNATCNCILPSKCPPCKCPPPIFDDPMFRVYLHYAC